MLSSSTKSKSPEQLLMEKKHLLQKELVRVFLALNYSYTGAINFSFGSGRFFLDFYCPMKYWYSLSESDLIIVDNKGAELHRFDTAGIDKDEYFNLMLLNNFSPLIQRENVKSIVHYIQNVVIPTVNALK